MDLFGDLISALDRRRKGLTAQLKPTREEKPAAQEEFVLSIYGSVWCSN
jgi:hypothetical protein